MKKMILSLIAMLVAAPVMATEPSDLNGLGLAGLSVVSEDAGMEVRGLGSVAGSSGLSTMRLFVIDPNTGSTFNANTSNFSASSSDATVSTDSAASAGTFASMADISATIDGFTFTVDAAVGSGGSGNTAATPTAFEFNITTGAAPTFGISVN